jgi:hypothetical protein
MELLEAGAEVASEEMYTKEKRWERREQGMQSAANKHECCVTVEQL